MTSKTLALGPNMTREATPAPPSPPAGATTAQFLLRLRGQDVVLSGEITVGRTPECKIAFEQDLHVSRMHARLTVHAQGVLVEDLGSSNGVFVNNIRIVGPRLLVPGDVLRIGAQEMVLHHGTRFGPRRSITLPDVPLAIRRDSFGASSDGEEMDSVTARQNVFDVLGSLIDRAVLGQNWEEASRLLRPCLEKIHGEAQVTRELDPSLQDPVCAFAINLASATGKGEWIDYLVSLYTILGRPMPAQVVAMLPEVVRTVDYVNVIALQSYASTLRTRAHRFTPVERQLCTQIDSVVVLAMSRPK